MFENNGPSEFGCQGEGHCLEGRNNHLCTWRHQTSSPCFSELDGAHIQVEAALSEELPMSVLLGIDISELTHLISGTVGVT